MAAVDDSGGGGRRASSGRAKLTCSRSEADGWGSGVVMPSGIDRIVLLHDNQLLSARLEAEAHCLTPCRGAPNRYPPGMRPETRYARSGDVHLAYQTVGDGPIDVLFIDQWWSNVDTQWDVPPLARMLERVASFSRLILLDKRGTGLSDPVPLG